MIIDPGSSNGMFLRVKIDVYLVIELFFIVTTDNAYDNEEFEGSAVSSQVLMEYVENILACSNVLYTVMNQNYEQ